TELRSASGVSRPAPAYKYLPRPWVPRAGQKGRASFESPRATSAGPPRNHTRTNAATRFLPICPDNTRRSDKQRHTTRHPSHGDKTEYVGSEKRSSSHSQVRLLRIEHRQLAA